MADSRRELTPSGSNAPIAALSPWHEAGVSRMARHHRALACLAVFSLAGCGATMQTVIGWTSVKRSERLERTAALSVETRPSGAELLRFPADPEGSAASSTVAVKLGPAPLVDRPSFYVEKEWHEPTAWGLVIGGALELALGVVLIGVNDGGGLTKPCDDPSQNETCLSTLGAGVLFTALGSVELGGGILYRWFGSDTEEETEVPVSYEYRASFDRGATASRTVQVPGPEDLLIDLAEGEAPPVQALEETVPNADAEDRCGRTTVAVMEIRDANSRDRTLAIRPALLRNMEDLFPSRLAESGFRVVDGGLRDAARAAKLDEAKAESYEPCVDSACQIDLGRALAASHVLSVSVTRFDERCVLAGELIDLGLEATVAASTARGPCTGEGFYGMVGEIAESLAAKLDCR